MRVVGDVDKGGSRPSIAVTDSSRLRLRQKQRATMRPCSSNAYIPQTRQPACIWWAERGLGRVEDKGKGGKEECRVVVQAVID